MLGTVPPQPLEKATCDSKTRSKTLVPVPELVEHGLSFPKFGIFDFRRKGGEERSPEVIERTAREQRELEKKVALIARVFSGDYDVEVLPSSDGSWQCGIGPEIAEKVAEYVRGEKPDLSHLSEEELRPTQIFYSREDVRNKDEQAVLGIMRHEVGHAKHTDYRVWFEGQRFAIEQGYLPLAWANIANALEDPWINNKEIADSVTVREQMRRAYEINLPKMVACVGALPASVQLGANIIHYWATGESIAEIKDEQVRKVFEEIRPDVDRYFEGETAQQNFEVLKKQIWPAYVKLEEKTARDETLKELARQETHQPPPPSEREEKSSSQSRKSWFEILKSLFGRGKEGKGGSPDQASNAPAPKPSRLNEQDRQRLREEIARQQSQGGGGAVSEEGRSPEGVSVDPNRDRRQIDLQELSKESIQALQEAIDSLSPEELQALEQCAREALDAQYADELKDSLPKQIKIRRNEETGERVVDFGDPKNQPDPEQQKQEADEIRQRSEHHQREVAAERDRKTQAQRRRALHQLQQAEAEEEMQEFGFAHDERELYDRFKRLEAAMSGHIARFLRVFERYLPRQDSILYEGEFYSGSKLNKRSVLKRAPVKDHRFYQRRGVAPLGDPKLFVTLIIDNSGSMNGEKMEESLKTAIFWARVLQDFNIPFAIKAFDYSSYDIKLLNQDYDSRALGIKPNLMRHCNASGGSTDMGTPLVEADETLTTERRNYHEFLSAVFVISDSGANRGMTGEELRRHIQAMQQHSIVTNFILTKREEELEEARQYFGEENVIAVREFSELPNEAFRALRREFQNYTKRLVRQ